MPADPRVHYRSSSNSRYSKFYDFLKQIVDLTHILGVHCPFASNLGTPSSPLWNCGFVIPDVKLAFSRSRQTGWEFIWDIFSIDALPQLKAGFTHLGNVLFTGLWFEMEKITKRSKWGSIPKDS
jgi:hypothetical protein